MTKFFGLSSIGGLVLTVETMKTSAITNTKIILEDGIIWDGTVLFEGDKIAAFGKSHETPIPVSAKVYDARGLYTAPGFVDVHNHGGNGYWFYNEPEHAAEYFLKHGQTTVLPAVYFNLDYEQTITAMNTIRNASKSGAARIIKGLYMEGPYMNPKYGSDNKNIKWKKKIASDEFTEIVDTAGDFVKVWCIAPEREGIEDFLSYARQVNPTVVFSLGHCDADTEMIHKLKRYGIKNQTHHTDSGQPQAMLPGLKSAGADEYCLYDEDLYAELICDYVGVHVRPFYLRMAVKIKGVDKIILITDSTAFTGEFKEGGPVAVCGPDLVYDEVGWLAGCKLTMDAACRNMMMHTGYGLCHVIKFATANPAKMAGLYDELGSINVGKKANLIIIDDMVNIKKVIFEGEEV